MATIPKPGITPPAPVRLGYGTPILSPKELAINRGLFLPLGDFKEPEDHVRKRIGQTFSICGRLLTGVINGDISGLMFSGIGGVGKTFEAEKVLKQAVVDGMIDLTQHNSYLTAVELYCLLYENREGACVTLIDDCDNIWKDQKAIGVMKAALDTKLERIVHWGANSPVLRKKEYPPEFLMQGAVVFITNVDIRASIDRNDAWSRHHHALLRRITYLDMGIRTKHEVFIRLKMLMDDPNFIKTYNLTAGQIKTITEWIFSHIGQIHDLSINTVMKLAQYIQADPKDWTDLAEVTLFSRS